MNIYICGQKTFGLEVLKLLLRLGHNIVGVSAPPESPVGRPDRLYTGAINRSLPVMASGSLNAATLPEGVDLIVCAHSHDFVGLKTRQKAKLGAIGYHPSLLPLHRGRDAIRWALKMGDRTTGGTVYWLTDTVDGGPIAAQEWCFIRPGDDPGELWRRDLMPIGLRLFERVLKDIEAGRLVKVPQNEKLATWEPSWGRQPIMKPDLIQIGHVEGYEIKVAADNLSR
jgi:methionyl-tRNA formyltransferase